MRNVLETLAPTANQNCTNYMAEALAVSGNVPPQRLLNHASVVRKEVERCRRDRRRAPQSPSPVSMTAPARICR